MKKLFLLFAPVCWSLTSFAQILLEDKSGDQIVKTFIPKNDNMAFIKLNTGSQNLGFTYIVSSALASPNNYKIHEFGVQAKPTEGYAAVLKNGQFTPGVHLSYSLSKVTLFSHTASYTDWGGINVGYDINKYTLYRSDTAFSNQLSTRDFRGLTLTFNYSALINSDWIASLKAGYSRTNNYDDLPSIEAKDITTIVDAATSTERQITKTRTARQGIFAAYDAYPIVLSLTRVTPTDATGSAAAAKLRLGYTIYIKDLMSQNLPQTTAGLLFFLTKQASNGVRNPVFGIILEADDPFDVKKKNNGLDKRISIGFTTVFTL
jgi:hypothetical protein